MTAGKELEEFEARFGEFIGAYSCAHHAKTPSLVCIDGGCRQPGLICSLCLTINNAHKGHDSVEIHEFMGRMLEQLHSPRRAGRQAEAGELIDRIVESYDGLLKVLSDFHEQVSAAIKEFITAKSAHHQARENQLFEESILERLRGCNYDSLEAFNEGLKALIARIHPETLEFTTDSDNRNL
jgi:hypothetical protein